jgi:hypothetical protein
MERAYSVYGLRVLADAGIPGLLPSDIDTDRIDVRIRLNRMPPWWEARSATTDAVWYRSPAVDERGQPVLTVWKVKSGWYRLQYWDTSEFLVAPEGGEIWCAWPPGATAEDPMPYLAGPVLGFVLRLRGVCCLHASAVRIGQKIVAFSGPAHAGKSTTAAAFGKLGYAVVSDDITALVEREQSFFVQSGYPRLCLWPDAAESLYGPSEQLPRIAPEDGINGRWDKRYRDLTSGGYQFQTQSLPLSAIYLLGERAEGAPHPAIETVSACSALVTLSANTYMNYLLDSTLRSKEFAFLSRVVSVLPVRRVIPQADASCLPRLCEAILKDYDGLTDAPHA